MKEEERQKAARKEAARRSTAQPSDGGSANHSDSASHITQFCSGCLDLTGQSTDDRGRQPRGGHWEMRSGSAMTSLIGCVLQRFEGQSRGNQGDNGAINQSQMSCAWWAVGLAEDGGRSRRGRKAMEPAVITPARRLDTPMTLSLYVYADVARVPSHSS